MDSRSLRAASMATACFTACGCARIFAAGTKGSGPPLLPYAGFGAEAAAVAQAIKNPPPLKDISPQTLAMAGLIVLDMPMCAVVDTLSLPGCLIENIRYKN